MHLYRNYIYAKKSMRNLAITIFLLLIITNVFAQSKYQKDFDFYWQTVNENYAYFDRQHNDWAKVKTIYQPALDAVKDETAFMHLLESVNNELYNGHVFLNRNDNASNRCIPTGSDLKVSWLNDQFVITEIREGFSADLCGLRAGMVITSFNDMPVKDAIKKYLPKSPKVIDKDMYEYAANMLLAGTHDTKRVITVDVKGRSQHFQPDLVANKTEEHYKTVLEAKILPGNIGYIRVNNSLGNPELIKAFDSALNSMMNTAGLIYDLTETPSGGNAYIAKAMMGRFIEKELPYQKHIYTPEERETGIRRAAIELVSPRPKTYKMPLVVMVNNWTGSMGEGIAIGLDAMKRGKIVGTKMAGLLGEIFSFETPETKIPFSFPCVQLQHINGQPREDFIPPYPAANHAEAIKIGSGLILGKK